MGLGYLRDPEEIYRQSFATIRREADLSRFDADEAEVVVRLIHACGMIDLVSDFVAAPGAAKAGVTALRSGAPIFCDVEMVDKGIIRKRLPRQNAVICTLGDDRVSALAQSQKTTRSAAAVDLWDDTLVGAIIAIGNAPTALFRLLERLQERAPKPALIIGMPVGFVGAVESKQALIESDLGFPFMTITGRRGGSALAAAAVNALAGLAAR